MSTIPQKIQLARDLGATRILLERRDQALEIAALSSSPVSAERARHTSNIGQQIGALALRFSALYPEQMGIAKDLIEAGNTVSSKAGKMSMMAADNVRYGSNWGSALDAPCAAMAAAVDAIYADVEKQAFVKPSDNNASISSF